MRSPVQRTRGLPPTDRIRIREGAWISPYLYSFTSEFCQWLPTPPTFLPKLWAIFNGASRQDLRLLWRETTERAAGCETGWATRTADVGPIAIPRLTSLNARVCGSTAQSWHRAMLDFRVSARPCDGRKRPAQNDTRHHRSRPISSGQRCRLIGRLPVRRFRAGERYARRRRDNRAPLPRFRQPTRRPMTC